MISKIYPADEVSERTLEFARRIAKLPTVAALLIKESVNQTVDNQGFYNSLQAAFTLHQLNHAYWAERYGDHRGVSRPEDSVEDWRNAPKLKPALKDV
jgi:enoyl-CoA hydratase